MKSNLPEYIDHKKAVEMVAKKLNADPKEVDRIVTDFFGHFGIRTFVKHQISFTLPFIGRVTITKKGKEIKEAKKRAVLDKNSSYKIDDVE